MTRISLPALILFFLLSSNAQAQSFQNLLADNSLDLWQAANGGAPGDAWKLEDGGVLHLTGRGGNLLTKDTYGDFELWFEFRVSPKGNNGIKYRVRQYGGSWLGLEYQVLDDDAFPRLTRDHLTGSLYDLVVPKPTVTRLNPAGAFNVGKIRVHNGRTQHWVNGQLMIDTPLYGSEWKNHVAGSKFKNREGFGENALGRIMLTDHNSETWYRNIFIRRLNNRDCR